jgi:hypothetical protein
MLNSFINGVASVFMVMPVANVQPIKAATVAMPPRQGTARYWLHVGQHLHTATQTLGQDLQANYPNTSIRQVDNV